MEFGVDALVRDLVGLVEGWEHSAAEAAREFADDEGVGLALVQVHYLPSAKELRAVLNRHKVGAWA